MAYAVSTDSLFHSHSKRIEEVINKSVDVFLPSLDPVWRDTVLTSQGVGAADAIGRDMLITKVFQGGLTGVIENSKLSNDFVLFGDKDTAFGSKLYQQQLNYTFPDATQGTNQLPYRLQIPMRALVTNFMMTLGELQAEASPAFIGEILGPKLEGFSKNIAHTLCNYWYLKPQDNHKLYECSDATDNFDVTSSTCTLKNVKAIDRWYVGMRVDIWKNDLSQRRNGAVSGDRTEAVVTTVDELAGTVIISCPGNWASNPINADIIFYAGTDGSNATDGTSVNSTGIAGMNAWLVTGNDTIDGTDHNLLKGDAISGEAIDVNTHPEFKSLGITSVGSLTEHKLRKYLARFHAGKNKYGQYIDCLIASDGVWMAYEATKIGREMIDRTNRLSSMNQEGTQDGFNFTFDGRTYTGYSSMYADDGQVYGIRKGGTNWKRYVPSSYKGLGSMSGLETGVPFNFVGGALTGGSNQMPIYKTGGPSSTALPTEGIQMPGMLRMQLVPDQPAGMILDGVTTDTVYAS
tara:strand:- start:2792 stop:4345 length:1554 start_codon:yes stop_codon:yes gene_type:complete